MQNQKQLRQALRDFIITRNPQLMVTFNYQRQVTFDQMRAHTIHFANQAQRQVLGRNWSRFAAAERLSFIGVAENLDTNSHVHAAVAGQTPLIEFLISSEAAGLWKGVDGRCGQLHFALAKNPPAIAAYMTKTLYQLNSLDRCLFYAPQRPAGRQ